MKRVGFWRALLELNLGHAVLAASYLWLARVSPPPWAELLGSGLYLLFAVGAYRLSAGSGDFFRRLGRSVGWAALGGAVTGITGYLIYQVLPINRPFLGATPEALAALTLDGWLWSYVITALCCFAPVRLALAVINAHRSWRLRWQLTLSYLLLGTLTTVLIFGALGLVLALLTTSDVAPPVSPRDVTARIAQTVRPAVLRGDDPAFLSRTLADIVAGNARVVSVGLDDDTASVDVPIRGVTALLLVAPDGTLLASSNPELATGQLLSYDDRRAWEPLLGLAQTECVNATPADGLLADSAGCPIRDDNGLLVATLVLETTAANEASQLGAEVGFRVGAFFAVLASSLVGLALASPIILAMASLFGFFLARGITRRVERLAVAAHALAEGDLAQRVTVDGSDEVARLSADFNAMAQRLEERELALAAEKARAERLLEANRQLIAGVSHELRTPVTVIRGYVEALSQQYGDQLPTRDLGVIQSEVDRLTHLIEDLFTLARAEVQQLPLTITPVDVGQLASDLAATVAPLARRERRVEIVAQIEQGLAPAYADRARLNQVLVNLVQNALRHTPEGGIVAIEAAAHNDHVAICVADTGVGIPPDELAHIFERFYRGDSSRNRETGGAGLGLALVKELSEAMGGSVIVESQPGRGSRFTVTLRAA